MPARIAVVGAGIIGLATAARLQERLPDAAVTVLDKEARVAAHQSSHNSGVLHAGIYYEPGSLKARLCRRGRAQLEELADAEGIPILRCGKLVVAVDAREVSRLDDLERRARANGVTLTRLDRDGIGAVEPEVAGLAALHTPETAVIDFAQVCERLAERVRAGGGEVVLGTEVTAIEERSGEVVLTCDPSGAARAADVVVTCAGLQADRFGGSAARIVPFRGSWRVLAPAQAGRVRGNVYPVPDPRFPFLGVHLTPRLDGTVLAGPNAVPAARREAYRRGGWPDRETAATWLREPGARRLALRHLGPGVREILTDRSDRRFARLVARYLPGVTAADLAPGPTGIRAQLVERDGTLVDDFRLEGTRRVVHVRNAPSPAATSSLAIAELVRDEVLKRLDLG